MYCARSIKKTNVMYQYARHLPPIYIYIHCARSIKRTNVVYLYGRHLCFTDGGVYLPSIYIYIVLDLAITLIWCTGSQGIYAQ